MPDIVRVLRSRDPSALRRALRADPDAGTKAAAIVEAGRLGHPALLEPLLRHGADPNASYRGYRPLHALIQEKPHTPDQEPDAERLRCMDLLLCAGADPELPAAWPPASALLVAAFAGARPFVDRLLAAGAQEDAFTAAALCQRTRVQNALRGDPDLARAATASGLTALMCCAASRFGQHDAACARDQLAIARLLLDGGADANALARSWSHDVDAAYFACGTRQGDVLALLLERGADPDRALVSALWNDVGLAAICLARGADPDRARAEGRPPLNELVRWGQFEPAQWLLAKGASPNLADDRGWTALHQAASRGNANMVQALLDAGGDPAIRDAEGHTPADVAASRGKPVIARLLAR